MPEFTDKSKCTGCTACASICSQKCIQMKKDDAGFEFPEFADPSRCIACGACERVCPVLAKESGDGEASTTAYAAFSKNDILRRESSSGGIFSELATAILQEGGIVYGASYDDKGVVRHVAIEDEKALGKLRGAKYSQSILGDSFQIIKTQLNSGRKVLFSGTPCQVAGLKALLKKEYDNLICIDFVCHGVPSPMVWEKYLKYRAKIDNDSILPKYINLRNKESGWSNYSYSIEFAYDGEKRYLCKNKQDPFMNLFVNDFILRESCSDCCFKGFSRASDITLGDFWGIWDIDSEMDDNKGTSLILIHSIKGNRMLETIAENIKMRRVTLDQAASQNPSLLKSSVHKTNRENVLKVIRSDDFRAILPMLIRVEQSKKRSSIEMVKNVFKKYLKKYL